MSSPNAEKGARYLAQLDQALCNGSWAEIQELARKTDKHAPDRKCFALAARSEAQIASALHRPTSAASNTASSIHGLGELIPKLTEAIAAEKKYAEDAYAAKACLAEIYWLREESADALRALPQGGVPSKPGSHAVALGWLEVCDVKTTFIRVAALEAIGQEEEARQLYLATAERNPGSRTPELRKWTERLLGRGCMFISRRTEVPTTTELSLSLRCFLTWSDFWQRSPAQSSDSRATPSQLDIPRRQVWKAFYDLLSNILQYGLLYNPEPSSTADLLIPPSDDIPEDLYSAAKRRQRSGVKRVETTYESLLLNETQFPKASQINTEIEKWVQQAVSNWKIFCGPDWTDSDLGDGGKQSVGRGVLDILYRAATKTFHSTPILRQLFTVHAALGEFDLAMHAFDSYVEIVSKGRAREEKTGKRDVSVDNDDMAFLTASEAIRVLCRYGDREQGEKAVEVGKMIEKWVSREASPVDGANLNGHNDERLENGNEGARLQPRTLGAAYRAIGISQAHWARTTYDADTREPLRTIALNNLRMALSHDQEDIETGYALALALAENRDVTAATQVMKRIIASPGPDEDEETESNDFRRERQLLPMWHLLAMCLTAKADYEQAAKMCELAFEQFGDLTVLLGENFQRTSSDTGRETLRSDKGLVDHMEGLEKEGIMQIKMSQLTFVELMEGAEAAVDRSHELLGLYARLYGNPELIQPARKPPPTAVSTTPSRFGGTIRSIAGSIRPRSAKHNLGKSSVRQSSVSLATERRPATGADATNGQSIGVPISITVTNEDGVPTEKSHHHKHIPFRFRGGEGDARQHGSLKEIPSSDNVPKSGIQSQSLPPQNSADNVSVQRSNASLSEVEKDVSRDTPASPEQPLKPIEHNAPHDAWPAPPGHDDQPPRQDIRLPAPHPSSNLVPDARLPTTQDRQQKISLLVKIWLFTAGLYLRADLLTDAAGAITEASKLAESFEAEVGSEHANARRFFERRWGGGKSVDELWADVWSAKGDLALARELPFEAISNFEQALAHFPDHAEGIIGLSNLLMDIYEEKIPAEEPRPLLASQPSASNPALASSIPPAPRPPLPTRNSADAPVDKPIKKPSAQQDPTPAALNRLASRDRAYMLLSNLTRLGSGWDNSEAWYTLARAYELSKQVGRAKQALWWVVELKENEPMRPWSEISAGGFTL